MGFSDQISCFLFTNGLLLLVAGLNRSNFFVDAPLKSISCYLFSKILLIYFDIMIIENCLV